MDFSQSARVESETSLDRNLFDEILGGSPDEDDLFGIAYINDESDEDLLMINSMQDSVRFASVVSRTSLPLPSPQGSHRNEDRSRDIPPAESVSSSVVLKQRIKARFESICDGLRQQLQDGSPHLSFSLSSIREDYLHDSPEETSYNNARLTFNFPGRTPEESWRFSVALDILHSISDAIQQDTFMTKRDLYYQNPVLFGSQAVVDRYCDLFARSLRVRRSDLGLTAAAKGLITGPVTFSRSNGSLLDLDVEAEPLLISYLDDFLHADLSKASCVLVIEKEATFHTIRSSNAWSLIKRHTILMTAKGYPDLASRQLLYRLSTASPWNGFRSLPVLVLTDYDPDGLAIFNTFKHGSMALAHEGSDSAVTTAVRLGLSSQHIKSCINTMDGQGLMSLTKRDRRKAQLMLQRETNAAGRSELQTMLMLNYKAELQLLDNEADGLARILMSLPSRHD